MSMLKVYFIRHGLTQSNQKGHTCGRTDALLSEEGRDGLKTLKETYLYPEVERVYASPAIRCQETAAVLYPEHRPVIVQNFWEYDFGKMEDCPMDAVSQLPIYEKWLEQAPDCAFEGGESLLEASFRVRAAMTRVVKDCIDGGFHRIAVIAHGEILSLLVRTALETEEPMESFLLCPNGMGFTATLEKEQWFQEQKMSFEGFFPEHAQRPKAEDSPYFKHLKK